MKITRYMGAFAVIAMLAACSTDDELGANTAANEVKIAATIGGNSIFTRSNPVGSATEQTSFNEGDAISVTTEGKTVIYTKKDGQWANANDYLVWTGNAQTFEACYPEKADESSTNSFSAGYVAADQSTVEKIALSDYMTCTKNETTKPDDRQLTLNFERQTARIIVKVSRFGDEFDGLAPTLSAVEVYSKLKVPAADGDSYVGIQACKIEESSSNVFYALVSPGTGNDAQNFLKLIVTYNDGNATQTKELYVTGIPALSKAKSYTYDVKIGKDKATIGSVSVADWAPGDAITGGDASILTPELIIKQALAAGKTDITLNLAEDFSDFSKITDALKNAKAGTINLTLKGCEKIKDFNSVKSLKSINLPDIITIYDRAFQDCTNLESVQVPEALKISNFAFTNCSRLESVYAPNLEFIERYIFDNCHNLRKVEFGNIESAAISSFDGVKTRNISLTLSADQMKMTQNFISWEPTSTKYKDSQDHKDRKFCNFIFKSIKCGDSTY